MSTASGKQPPSHRSLSVTSVVVSPSSTGSRWEVDDLDYLASIIGIIAMGQASHAAGIVASMEPAAPAFSSQQLAANAIKTFSIQGETDSSRDASRWHRDGLLFESISWIAAHEPGTGKKLIRDPHLKSTTQGLDGLMLDWDQSSKSITLATIFEDKCSVQPRKKFRDEVMPAFLEHHGNERGADLVATAAALIRTMGLSGTESARAAARVLELDFRAYRAGLAVTDDFDSDEKRRKLFKGFAKLNGMSPPRLIGATLITSGDLREWFDTLAACVLANLKLEESKSS